MPMRTDTLVTKVVAIDARDRDREMVEVKCFRHFSMIR